MGIFLPETTDRIEANIKVDVQREAPDSNPYLQSSWLRSLIAGFSRRIFDFYEDLRRTEIRVFPDTADDDTAPIWRNIYVGESNPETIATGTVVAQGTTSSIIPSGTTLVAGSNEYVTQSDITISANTLLIISITRSGQTATAITNGDHHLASSVPATISGSDQSEYNLVDVDIIVTGTDSFTYQVIGSPTTPSTGTIIVDFISGFGVVDSNQFGSEVNLDADAPLTLQSPIVGVDDTFNVDFGAIGGGSDEETLDEYKLRYLDKIRNPTANFNKAAIIAKAKEITGVTRVFVEEAGDSIGIIPASSLTRVGNIATFQSISPHGLDDGQASTITGAVQNDYNLTNARIIVENNMKFHYVVLGSPTTPATGTVQANATVPLGQSRTFFMRDNDASPIPTAAEVVTVKERIDAIRPVNTAEYNNIVRAPVAVVVNYNFTNTTPNTSSMRDAIEQNIAQFHEEQTTVGMNIDEDAYRAAIASTVDTTTGDKVQSFSLSSPSGDIVIGSGEIGTKGTVTF